MRGHDSGSAVPEQLFPFCLQTAPPVKLSSNLNSEEHEQEERLNNCRSITGTYFQNQTRSTAGRRSHCETNEQHHHQVFPPQAYCQHERDGRPSSGFQSKKDGRQKEEAHWRQKGIGRGADEFPDPGIPNLIQARQGIRDTDGRHQPRRRGVPFRFSVLLSHYIGCFSRNTTIIIRRQDPAPRGAGDFQGRGTFLLLRGATAGHSGGV